MQLVHCVCVVKHLLDAEMEPKCDLLCRNCHARRTCKYAPSATAF
jgi:hypothetical protein